MQYSQIWGHVSNRFPATQDGLCKIWVNQGAQVIRRKRQWYWAEAVQTITLVTGQEEYALRGTGTLQLQDFQSMLDCRLELSGAGSASGELTRFEETDYDRIIDHARAGPNGIPFMYTIAGGAPALTSANIRGGEERLLVFPRPLATATNGQGVVCRFVREMIDMVADTDVPMIPDDYHDVIIAFAIWKGKLENRHPDASGWLQAFEMGVAEMEKMDDASRRRDKNTFQQVPERQDNQTPVRSTNDVLTTPV